MSYPMAPMPTGFEFGEWSTAKGFPVTLRSSGYEPSVLYYERILPDGSKLRSNVLPPDGFDPDKCLELEKVRELCESLEIPPEVFQLTLE